MPLLWISLVFMAGIVTGAYLPWTLAGWGGLSVSALLLAFGLRYLPDTLPRLSPLKWFARPVPRLRVAPLVLLAFAALGAARMQRSGPDIDNGHIAALNDRGLYRIQGVLIAPPDRRDSSTQLRLMVEQAAPLGENGQPGPAQPAHGLMLIMQAGQVDWQYGDRLRLDGKPVTPPENEDFSYRDYLARQDVYTYLTYPMRVQRLQKNAGSPLLAAIYHLRDWAYAEIYHLYPAPEAPLLSGILLGLDNDLPDGLARAFQDTGTAHVIAISGFNIAILADLFSKLFGKIVSRWWATLLAILAVAGYTLMVGATPSVVRAAIMGSLALIAAQIGRRTGGANALFLTGALMCLPNPHLPWDASFQLSFGATLGLILLGDPVQNGFTGLLERRIPVPLARKISAPIGEYFLLTLAAQAMTLPIILYHFQRLSLSSLIANPLILPPQPLVMVLSGAAVLAGLISDPLAHTLAWLAWPLTAYTIHMVEWLGSIPNGVLVIGDFNLGSAGLAYIAIFSLTWSQRFPKMIRGAVTPTVGLVILALITGITWRAAGAAPDGRLHLVLADIEGSPLALVIAPRGQTLLINGSPSPRLLNDTLGRWLSPFERGLDGLLVNSQQSSALTSLEGLIERYPPRSVWWGAQPPANRSAEDFRKSLRAQHIPYARLEAGEILELGDQSWVEVIATTDTGSALLLTWQDFRVLIPAGVPPARLETQDLAQLSLLVLEKRDLEKTSPEEWAALGAQAVIDIGGVEDRAGRNWLGTRPQGWYAITSDGRQMWLERR